KLTDDIVFTLKKDLRTENNIFTTGTRIAFKENYRTMYHSSYQVYSADTLNYMYVHRIEGLKEIIKNIERDENQTDQYRKFVYEKHRHQKILTVGIIILYEIGFIISSVVSNKIINLDLFGALIFTSGLFIFAITLCIFTVLKFYKWFEAKITNKINIFLL
ncbi:MAG: hypothetical protein K2K02_03965, partial [Ruminococcus sp.]|nr:hypothetical protein [Ruminococcus sp.]